VKGHEGDEGPGASLLGGDGKGAGTVQPGAEKAQGDLVNGYKCLQGGCKEDRTLSSCAQFQDQRQRARTEPQEFPSTSGGTLSVAQVAQGGGGVSTLGDAQEPSGHSHGQPALVVLLEQGVGPGDLQRPLPTSTLL